MFVNVSATIDDGSTNSSVMRYAILYVSTNVFPEPGTDATLMLPSVCVIASVCSFVAFFSIRESKKLRIFSDKSSLEPSAFTITFVASSPSVKEWFCSQILLNV